MSEERQCARRWMSLERSLIGSDLVVCDREWSLANRFTRPVGMSLFLAN